MGAYRDGVKSRLGWEYNSQIVCMCIIMRWSRNRSASCIQALTGSIRLCTYNTGIPHTVPHRRPHKSVVTIQVFLMHSLIASLVHCGPEYQLIAAEWVLRVHYCGKL